jgi:hypothetical protein
MGDPRYPIGRFDPGRPVSADERPDLLDALAHAPAALRAAIDGLSATQLDTPYRDGGWTVRQVVHHVPDSHANAYVRFKLALTEDAPLIRTYDEVRWAELADCSLTPIETSLLLLEALHVRWTVLLRALSEEQWQRPLRHPEWGTLDLTTLLGMYAWHGRHHVAHITTLRERSGW